MKESVLAIPYDEISDFLEQFDLLSSLERGEIKCLLCGKTLNQDNIGAIYPYNNEIIFACDNLFCLQLVVTKFAPLRNVKGEKYDYE